MPGIVTKIVLVKCLGIACPTGFQLNTPGYEPSYVSFTPGIASPIPEHHADWLIAQDPSRFSVEKPAEKQAEAQPKKAAKK